MFEHQRVECRNYEVDDRLDEMSEDGWELVAVTVDGTTGRSLYFKRPWTDDEQDDEAEGEA